MANVEFSHLCVAILYLCQTLRSIPIEASTWFTTSFFIQHISTLFICPKIILVNFICWRYKYATRVVQFKAVVCIRLRGVDPVFSAIVGDASIPHWIILIAYITIAASCRPGLIPITFIEIFYSRFVVYIIYKSRFNFILGLFDYIWKRPIGRRRFLCIDILSDERPLKINLRYFACDPQLRVICLPRSYQRPGAAKSVFLVILAIFPVGSIYRVVSILRELVIFLTLNKFFARRVGIGPKSGNWLLLGEGVIGGVHKANRILFGRGLSGVGLGICPFLGPKRAVCRGSAAEVPSWRVAQTFGVELGNPYRPSRAHFAVGARYALRGKHRNPCHTGCVHQSQGQLKRWIFCSKLNVVFNEVSHPLLPFAILQPGLDKSPHNHSYVLQHNSEVNYYDQNDLSADGLPNVLAGIGGVGIIVYKSGDSYLVGY